MYGYEVRVPPRMISPRTHPTFQQQVAHLCYLLDVWRPWMSGGGWGRESEGEEGEEEEDQSRHCFKGPLRGEV